jgi:hypothetical protein
MCPDLDRDFLIMPRNSEWYTEHPEVRKHTEFRVGGIPWTPYAHKNCMDDYGQFWNSSKAFACKFNYLI